MIATPEEWAVYHATTFGLTTESDIAGFIAWGRTFANAAFPVSDLVEATDWMVLNASVNFRREHLDHIRRRLDAARSARVAVARNEGRKEFVSKDCGWCDGTGLVSVPHRRDVANGVWGGKYRCAVTCVCPRGEELRGFRDKQDRKPMGLMEYEKHVPNWRELLFRKDAEQRQLAEHESAASVRDKQFGRLDQLIQSIMAKAKAA